MAASRSSSPPAASPISTRRRPIARPIRITIFVGRWLRAAPTRISAPTFGFAFAPDGLKTVAVPAQVWRAAEDRHQPDAWYDEAVRQALPRPPDYRVVAGANHYSFLTPCGPRLAARAPQICADPPGFDRAAFHQAFDAEVVRFFQANLR